MQTLFTNCTVWTGPGSPLIDNGYLLTRDTTIAKLGEMTVHENLPEADTVIDGHGKLLMPGLINSHNHCAMTLFRGLADDLELTAWLQEHIFPAEAKHVSPEMVYWCTRLAAAEMLLSGTTCVSDAYFFSAESARALRDCGMRAVVGHGVVDFPAPSVPDPKKNIETVAGFIDDWFGRDPLITPAVFAHAPYTCSPATLTKAKALADERGVRFLLHLAESPHEQGMIIDPQGSSPVKHLAALDLLDSNTVCVHTIWLDEEDLDILAKSGAHVITCPQSNLKLASGIAGIPEMLAAGINVGLGTDGCASNNSLDMFKEMDILAKLHKVNSLEATAVPAGQVLQCATTNNGKLLGIPDIGRLEVGCQADMVLLDLQTPRLMPFYSADLLVYGASGADVESVMIAGDMVVKNKKIHSFDLEETMAGIREMASSLSL